VVVFEATKEVLVMRVAFEIDETVSVVLTMLDDSDVDVST
jgi:hypothetical protein